MMGAVGITVRTIVDQDISRIAEIHHVARSAYYRAAGHEPDAAKEPGAEEWKSYLAQPGMQLACACAEDGVSVGFACAFDGQEASRGGLHSVELVALYVDPARWGRGVGTVLHDWYLGRLRDSKAAEAGTLYVWSLNERALRFYGRCRWYEDGPQRPGPLNAAFLSLRLDRPAPALAPRER
jgi:GNAT superfamily N-acetyltransferase